MRLLHQSNPAVSQHRGLEASQPVAGSTTTRVRVVLPAFNEEQALRCLIPRIVQTLGEFPWPFDILIVDDGSSDGTASVGRELAADYPVTVFAHESNLGLGAAISNCLINGVEGLADEDIVIAMDADNTHPPQLIARMVPMIREGYDVVIASRFQAGARVVGLAWQRKLLSHGARWMMRLLFPIAGCRDYTCGFRAYRVGLLRTALSSSGGVLTREPGFACMAEVLMTLSKHGAVVGEVPLLLRYDYKSGASKMRIASTVQRTLRMVLRQRRQHRRSH